MHTPVQRRCPSVSNRSLAIALFAAATAQLGFSAIASAQWVTPQVIAPGVQYRTFQSVVAGTTVSYHIYLPPTYNAAPQRRFPVLYWLHGSGSAVAGIAPLSDWFDDAIAAGLIPPMLVVFPNGMEYRMWCDSKDGQFPMESVVINELLPEIDAQFRTIARRRGRIVEGFSMGGQGAGRLGMRRPDLFAGISMLGAGPLQLDFLDEPEGSTTPLALRLQIYQAVWGSDPAYYLSQHPRTIAQQNVGAIAQSGAVMRQAVGLLDVLHPMNVDTHDHLSGLGLEVSLFTPPGVGHDVLPLFAALGASNWDFYNQVFGCFTSTAGDADRNGVVEFADINSVLTNFGAAYQPGSNGPGDADGSGAVDFLDIATVLANFGSSCP